MTANQTLRPTKEQLLLILKSCYCLIDNWGGSIFYYITNPTLEAEGCCNLFENKKAKTYMFSLDKSKIWFEAGCIHLSNTEDNLTHSFTALTKVNLEEFVSN